MRKIFPLLILLFFGYNMEAQLLPPNQPEQDACDALLLCGNTFTSTYSYQGIGVVSDLTNCPCSGGEGNSMWLRLEITTPGIIVFTITPLNGTDDYDFAVVDITGKSCSTFTSSDVIRCNFNNNQPGSNVGGVVGLNTTSTIQFTTAGATGGSFLQQINANAGDVYLIMINNFGDPFVGGPSSGFTIDFTGSTAIFNDNGTPYMKSAYQPCGDNLKIVVPMSENIQCSSIEPTGTDFSISGGGVIASATANNCSGSNGYDDTVILTLASPLSPGTYTLSIQNGTDGNTLLDLCNHADTIPNQVQFTISASQLAYSAVIPPACYQFKLALSSKANCNSIASNGTDFRITGPQLVNVASAVGVNCDAQNLADTILLTLSNPIITDGTYTITAQKGTDGNTLFDNCGLSQAEGDAIGFSINSFDGLVSTIPDTVLCNEGYLLLSGTDNSTQPATYLWTPGTLLNDSTQLQTLAYINHSNKYTLLAIDKDGCPHRASTNVTLSERKPTLTASQNTICDGEKVQLNASGGLQYQWISDLNTLSCFNCPSPVATPSVTTQYAVSIQDEYSCADTLTTTILVHPLPDINALPGDTSVPYGTQLQLIASGAVSYTWSPADFLNNPFLPAPTAYITDNVVFIVTGLDNNGCSKSDSVFITVTYNHYLALPNAFTPNGDGRNDVFKIGNMNFQKLQEFSVYNRWGQQVFTTNDPKQGWDGTYNGQPQEMGVYTYLIQVAYPDGTVDNYKGDVTLIR